MRQSTTGIKVTLLEGSVQVARADLGESQILKPGEQATFADAKRGIAVRPANTQAEVGWTRGWLIFQNQPLAQVVAEINRYAPERKLRLDDPSLGELPFSGNFRIGYTASITEAMAAILPVRVEQRKDEFVLFRVKQVSR